MNLSNKKYIYDQIIKKQQLNVFKNSTKAQILNWIGKSGLYHRQNLQTTLLQQI